MTTRSHSSPLSSPQPVPPSPAITFPLFPLLPLELQLKVYSQATKEWMVKSDPECLLEWPKKLPFGVYFQVNKSRLEWYIDTDPRYLARSTTRKPGEGRSLLRDSGETIWVLPPLLAVSRLARGAVWDILTEAAGMGRGAVVDLYCEDYYDPNDDDYGLRVQDFRRLGLSLRVKEEEERLGKSEMEKNVWKTKLEHKNGRHGINQRRNWVVLPKCPYYRNSEWDGRLVVSDEGGVVEDHS